MGSKMTMGWSRREPVVCALGELAVPDVDASSSRRTRPTSWGWKPLVLSSRLSATLHVGGRGRRMLAAGPPSRAHCSCSAPAPATKAHFRIVVVRTSLFHACFRRRDVTPLRSCTEVETAIILLLNLLSALGDPPGLRAGFRPASETPAPPPARLIAQEVRTTCVRSEHTRSPSRC